MEYHIDQKDDGCDIDEFVEIMYGSENRVPDKLRRRMIQPYMVDYINRPCWRVSAQEGTRFNTDAAARLINDMLSWQDPANHGPLTGLCLQVMTKLAPTCVSARAAAIDVELRIQNENKQENVELGVEEVASGMKQMAID